MQKARGSQKEGKCEQQEARFEGTDGGGRSGSDGQSVGRPASRKASSTSPAETRKSLGLFAIIGAPGLSPTGRGGRQREGSEKQSLCSFLSVGGGLLGARSRSALDVSKLVELEQSAHSSGSIGGKAGGAAGSARAGKAKEKEKLPVDLLSVARAAAATERALIAQSSSTLRRAHSKRERGSQGTLGALPGFALEHAQLADKAANAKSKERRSSQSFKQKLSRRSKRRGKSNENRYEQIQGDVLHEYSTPYIVVHVSTLRE